MFQQLLFFRILKVVIFDGGNGNHEIAAFDLAGRIGKLFIASNEYGVRILDIPSLKILNDISVNTRGIDGLKYLNGNLYAVKNGNRNIKKHGLFQIQLNKELNSIKKVKPVLIDHKLMNVPTTFDIDGSSIYLLANSQLDNLNQETMKIINPKDLSDTYILKIKMK